MVKTLPPTINILLLILLLSATYVQGQAVKVSIGDSDDSGDPITQEWNELNEKHLVVKQMIKNNELDRETFPNIEEGYSMYSEFYPIAQEAYDTYIQRKGPATYSYADDAESKISQCLDYLDPVFYTFYDNLSKETLGRYGLEKE